MRVTVALHENEVSLPAGLAQSAWGRYTGILLIPGSVHNKLPYVGAMGRAMIEGRHPQSKVAIPRNLRTKEFACVCVSVWVRGLEAPRGGDVPQDDVLKPAFVKNLILQGFVPRNGQLSFCSLRSRL